MRTSLLMSASGKLECHSKFSLIPEVRDINTDDNMAPQALRSRSRIAASARTLFLDRGYGATPVADIARHAGLSVQTIYNTVGNKAAVLSLVLDIDASGPDAPESVRDRMEQRATHTTTPGEVITLLATWFTEVHPRVAPILRVIAQAGATDPDIATLGLRRARQRFTNYHQAARLLRDRDGLRADLSDAQAAATIWSLGHPDTYHLLVLDQRWPLADYGAWLERQLAAALLPGS